MREVISKGVLAGVCVSMGCLIYLKVGGVAGAALFSVGLLGVMWHGLLLYTGKSGDVQSRGDMGRLMLTLLLNIVGCVACSQLFSLGDEVVSGAEEIVMRRAASLGGYEPMGFVRALVNGIACGIIMTLAVHSARRQHYWPLLIGIPAFIVAGFTHSVADAFYYAAGWQAITTEAMVVYALTAAGNFIGCNMYRLTLSKNKESI